ncbi:MAG: ATP-binding region ATPase domain protein [Clostridia bacterium]|jgi:signal transduction histidine kinase|nr:ATP-binding region ATPase domain protein [Clostridia bacterium]
MRIRSIFSILFRDILIPVVKLPFLFIKALVKMLQGVYDRLIRQLRFSVTFRITSMYAMVIGFILSLLSIGIMGSGFAYVMKSESDDLRKDFLLISSYMQGGDIQQDRLTQLAQLNGTSITVFDEKQKVIFTTEEEPAAAIFIDIEKNKVNVVERVAENQAFIASSERPENTIPKQVFNEYGYAMVLNDRIGDGVNTPYVQIINKLSQETVYAGIFIFTLITLVIVIIIIIVIVGYVTSKRLLQPIYEMTDTVKNVSMNQLDKRLDIRGSQNEFKDLAGTFNDMLDRLKSSYEMQNQFVSDASHELRTPISVIQGYANLLDRWGKDDRKVLDEAVAAIKSESESMKNLIEQLLFLARGDKDTQKLENQDFDTKELIDEIIKESRLIDEEHDIVSGRNESILINADRGLLKEAIRIFVDNSVKFTPAGGKIQLQCYSQEETAVITVEDNGIGISKEDLPHVFDRFYKADKSRTKNTGGTGLGMAIAKWIISKHGGTIRIESEINAGTKIIIALSASSMK